MPICTANHRFWTTRWVYSCAARLLLASLLSQAVFVPTVDWPGNVTLGEMDGEDSDSREQPVEEELVETAALPAQRTGRTLFSRERAFATTLPTPARRVRNRSLPSRSAAEQSGRNGIGGPLRC